MMCLSPHKLLLFALNVKNEGFSAGTYSICFAFSYRFEIKKNTRDSSSAQPSLVLLMLQKYLGMAL